MCCKGDVKEGDESMDDIEKDRKCTDVLWVGVFAMFWVGMVVVAIIGFTMGKPNKLIYAVSVGGEKQKWPHQVQASPKTNNHHHQNAISGYFHYFFHSNLSQFPNYKLRKACIHWPIPSMVTKPPSGH